VFDTNRVTDTTILTNRSTNFITATLDSTSFETTYETGITTNFDTSKNTGTSKTTVYDTGFLTDVITTLSGQYDATQYTTSYATAFQTNASTETTISSGTALVTSVDTDTLFDTVMDTVRNTVPEIPIPTDPYWNDVVSLLLFEGADQSNTIFDSKKSNYWLSTTNNKLTTTDPIYGNSSAYITTSTATSLHTSNVSLYENFSGDYTLEFEIEFEAFSTPSGFDTDVYLTEIAYGHRIGVFQQSSGSGGATRMYGKDTNSATKIYSGDLALNTKYHCALVRSGTTVTFWFNGVSMGTVTVTPGGSELAYRQELLWRGNVNRKMRIDNYRTTRYARYTAPFTPPSEAFPTQ